MSPRRQKVAAAIVAIAALVVGYGVHEKAEDCEARGMVYSRGECVVP